jgi:amphi-Trp domain-containing protein
MVKTVAQEMLSIYTKTAIKPLEPTMDLLDIKQKHKMRREEAAQLLHHIADSLASQNKLQLLQEGVKLVVNVPDQVEVELELELADDGNSLEIELNW